MEEISRQDMEEGASSLKDDFWAAPGLVNPITRLEIPIFADII